MARCAQVIPELPLEYDAMLILCKQRQCTWRLFIQSASSLYLSVCVCVYKAGGCFGTAAVCAIRFCSLYFISEACGGETNRPIVTHLELNPLRKVGPSLFLI